MHFKTSSNSQLLHHIQQRNTAAFAELYERHASVVLGFLTKIVKHRPRAEQLLEETFFALWEAPHGVSGSVREWLLRKACECCVIAGYTPSSIRHAFQAPRIVA